MRDREVAVRRVRVEALDLESLREAFRRQGQPRSSPSELQEHRPFLASELLECLPEVPNERVALVHTRVFRVRSEKSHINVGLAANHQLQLIPREEGEQSERNDRGKTVSDGGSNTIELVQSEVENKVTIFVSNVKNDRNIRTIRLQFDDSIV